MGSRAYGRRPRALFLAGLVLGVAGGSAWARNLTPVGVARIDVTPDEPVRLSGYQARKTVARGVDQPIAAKALAIGGDAGTACVLVSVDNLGVGAAIVEEVAARLERAAGLARARFVVASSHTHSAPCLTGVAPNIFGRPLGPEEQAAIDRYTRSLADRIERVALEALRDRRPARLSWSQGSVGFAANRRTKGGPVDHALPLLRVTDPDGALRAVLLNYACHCTTIDPAENKVSGDWAGFAQAAIERDHPEAVALTVVGCGADANPPRGKPGLAEEHGRAIAAEVNRLLEGEGRALDGPPAAAFERFKIPFDTLPTRAELEGLVKAGGAPGYNASTQLAKLDRGEPLQAELDYSAQVWAFGDALAVVFLPGEVVVDYALRLKREYDPARLWITAYANDLPCYIPSERVLKEGGYEGAGAMVYYGRPTRLKAGVEETIVGVVRRLLPPAYRAGGVPR